MHDAGPPPSAALDGVRRIMLYGVTGSGKSTAAEEICAGETWLLDTAYGVWLDVPLSRVELIVALDYPRWFSLQRLVRRAPVHASPRPGGVHRLARTGRSRPSRYLSGQP